MDQSWSKHYRGRYEISIGNLGGLGVGYVGFDCLSKFFIKSLDEVGLLDVEPIKLTPTKRNTRVGNNRIAKRLDCFLTSIPFLDEAFKIRQWMCSRGDTCNTPILSPQFVM